MKIGKRILAFLLSALLAIPLLGCSDGSAQLMERMAKRMQDVQSARMDICMDVDVSAAGEMLDLQAAMQLDYIREPLAMKMQMDLSSAGQSEQATMYLQQADTWIHAYMRQGRGDWQHAALLEGQLTGQVQQALNMTDIVNTLFDAKQFKKVGTEQIDGVTTVKISGKLGAETIVKLLLSSGLSEEMTHLHADALEQLRNIVTQMGETSITYWIDEEKAELRKAEVDMTQALNGLLQKLVSQVDARSGMQFVLYLIQFDTCKVTVSYTDIDALSSIEIPQEVLDTPLQSSDASNEI